MLHSYRFSTDEGEFRLYRYPPGKASVRARDGSVGARTYIRTLCRLMRVFACYLSCMSLVTGFTALKVSTLTSETSSSPAAHTTPKNPPSLDASLCAGAPNYEEG